MMSYQVVLCGSAVCDLAILTVEQDEFWEGVPVAQFQDEVPSLDDTVVAVRTSFLHSRIRHMARVHTTTPPHCNAFVQIRS